MAPICGSAWKFRVAVALIGIATLIGIAYLVVRALRRSVEQSELLNFLIGCSLFLVAAAPLLVVHQFAQTYRSLFTMTAIEMLALFWLLKQLPIGAFRLAAIFAALGIACSFADVYGYVSLGSRRVRSLFPVSRRSRSAQVPLHRYSTSKYLKASLWVQFEE